MLLQILRIQGWGISSNSVCPARVSITIIVITLVDIPSIDIRAFDLPVRHVICAQVFGCGLEGYENGMDLCVLKCELVGGKQRPIT